MVPFYFEGIEVCCLIFKTASWSLSFVDFQFQLNSSKITDFAVFDFLGQPNHENHERNLNMN